VILTAHDYSPSLPILFLALSATPLFVHSFSTGASHHFWDRQANHLAVFSTNYWKLLKSAHYCL
jgi:hypothetical protein